MPFNPSTAKPAGGFNPATAKPLQGTPNYNLGDLANILTVKNTVEAKKQEEPPVINLGEARTQQPSAAASTARGWLRGMSLGASEQLLPLIKTLAENPGYGSMDYLKSKTAQNKEELDKFAPKGIASTGGEVASYFTPGGAASGLFKGGQQLAKQVLPKAGKTLQNVVGGAVSMGEIGGGTKLVETGDPVEAAKTGLADAGLGLATGGLLAGGGKLLKGAADKIIASKVLSKSKPDELARNLKNLTEQTVEGVHNGKKIPKDIIGITKGIKSIKKQVDNKLTALNNNLESVLAASDTPINLNLPIEELRTKILSDPKFSGMSEQAINNILNQAKKSASRFGEGGVVTPLKANQFKQGLKPKTKFVLGSTPAQSYQQKLWNEIYIATRDKISKEVPVSGELNKRESELIPIKDAIEKLMEQNNKRSLLSLSDKIIGSGGLLGAGAQAAHGNYQAALMTALGIPALSLTTKALTSPQAAAGYYGLSKGLTKTAESDIPHKILQAKLQGNQ